MILQNEVACICPVIGYLAAVMKAHYVGFRCQAFRVSGVQFADGQLLLDEAIHLSAINVRD
jgi:hypothetical protein